MLKIYTLPITLLYTLALAIVSLIKLGSIPEYVPSFGDKLFHFMSYALLTVLWYYTFLVRFKISRMLAIVYAGLLAMIFGIIIEVLQGKITDDRVADLNDVFANVLGVILSIIILVIVNKLDVKNL